MKTFLLLLLATVLVLPATAGTYSRKAAPAQEQPENLSPVRQAVDRQHYTIEVTSVNPLRGPMQSLTTGYALQVRGDSVLVHLPYFGVSQAAHYGGSDGSIRFAGRATGYEATFLEGKGHRVKFDLRTPNGSYAFSLQIGPSGYATINVTPLKADFISYRGVVALDPTAQ
jgi:hypothetical protein